MLHQQRDRGYPLSPEKDPNFDRAPKTAPFEEFLIATLRPIATDLVLLHSIGASPQTPKVAEEVQTISEFGA
jgi:hypothetical protein